MLQCEKPLVMLTSLTKANAAAKAFFLKIKGSVLANTPIEPDPLNNLHSEEKARDFSSSEDSENEKDLMVALSESPIYGVPS